MKTNIEKITIKSSTITRRKKLLIKRKKERNNMNVKIVRLNSGEEILCNLTTTDTHHTLNDALIIIPQPDGQIGFMTWMAYADTSGGVLITNSFIAFVVEPDEQLKKEFVSHTSGIIIPETGPVVAGTIGTM